MTAAWVDVTSKDPFEESGEIVRAMDGDPLDELIEATDEAFDE